MVVPAAALLNAVLLLLDLDDVSTLPLHFIESTLPLFLFHDFCQRQQICGLSLREFINVENTCGVGLGARRAQETK